MTIIELLFWTMLALVCYTYIGYGFLLFIAVKIKQLLAIGKKPVAFKGFPSITLVIPAYNEKAFLQTKIQNSLELAYPQRQLNIILVTDGSDDGSEQLFQDHKYISVHHSPLRAGKMAAVNRIMPLVRTDLVVFTDANTLLNKDALLNIIASFNDPKVGCVAGEKRIIQAEVNNAAAGGEGLYWKYESTLKQWSSDLNSAIGAAGELFALRTKLYQAPPADTILDDFILSLAVVEQGYSIAYQPKAYAMESGSKDVVEEMKRKVRIAAGGLQAIYRTSTLLNPFKKPLFAFQYLSHRVLRWTITPIALFALLPMNIYLANEIGMLYTYLAVLQGSFYLAAGIGAVLQQKQLKQPIFFVPFYFLMMNISVLLGAKRLWLGRQSVLWEKAKRLEVTT